MLEWIRIALATEMWCETMAVLRMVFAALMPKKIQINIQAPGFEGWWNESGKLHEVQFWQQVDYGENNWTHLNTTVSTSLGWKHVKAQLRPISAAFWWYPHQDLEALRVKYSRLEVLHDKRW